MKKLVALVLCVVLAIAPVAAFAACKDDGKTIRVNEVTHPVFYSPLYVAIERRCFTEAGCKIELTDGGGSDRSMTHCQRVKRISA